MNERIKELERQATETVKCGLNGTCYPKHVGKILQEYYPSADKAEQLVHGPQIRNFDHDGTCVRFGDGTPDDHEVSDNMIEAIAGYDYLYLFDFSNDSWQCYARDGYVKPEVLRQVVIPVGEWMGARG